MAANARSESAVLLLLLFVRTAVLCADDICESDGLQPDYETECREYMRCERGVVQARYSCVPGRTFSAGAQACVLREPCVRHRCAPGDALAYAAPGSRCLRYYRCEGGIARHHTCAPGTWFDFEQQACARGAGTCYEPVCAGLVDGPHADVSHDCRRELECRGGALRAVESREPAGRPCPPPRTAAVALPVGVAEPCSDAVCSTSCRSAEDGAYADPATGCREYFVCRDGRVARRGVCDGGLLFDGERCAAVTERPCPREARGPCFGRADGDYRDFRSCRAWLRCRRERVVRRGSCEEGRVWDGEVCSPETDFRCAGPERSESCEGRPHGMYQDLSRESNCTRYYHCAGGMRTEFACPAGRIYDGETCVPAAAYTCPSLEPDSCALKTDGRYAQVSGCGAYYACAAGSKAVYECEPGFAFDGNECVSAATYRCPRADDDCAELPDGYHPDYASGCRRFFYCRQGEKITTLACFASRVFDGRSCVGRGEFACARDASPASNALGETDEPCARDGFYANPRSGCRSYHFCIAGARTTLHCPAGRVFNGHLCVPADGYACPAG